jgi:hypothetical protein
MSNVFVQYGPGSYRTLNEIKTSPTDQFAIRSGYTLYQQPIYNQDVVPSAYEGKILDSAFNADARLITQEWGLQEISDGTNLVNGKAYGFGAWVRYLTTYPVRQLQGLPGASVIGAMTQNNPYTKGASLGDRLLVLAMGDTAWTYLTYNQASNQVSVAGTIAYNLYQTDGVWNYVYISYSVPKQQFVGFLKSPTQT